MVQQISPKDNRRVAIFDRFVRNANHLLKGKSPQEVNKIIDEQDGFIKGIKDTETRNRLLDASGVLRITALESLENYNSVIKRLERCEQALKGKDLQEITAYFDEIANDLSKIPDLHMQLRLKKNFSYWRSRRLDDFYDHKTGEILNSIEDNENVAGETVKEITSFFKKLDSDILKINNPVIKKAKLVFSNVLKDGALALAVASGKEEGTKEAEELIKKLRSS